VRSLYVLEQLRVIISGVGLLVGETWSWDILAMTCWRITNNELLFLSIPHTFVRPPRIVA
jgi:hypothetical protein